MFKLFTIMAFFFSLDQLKAEGLKVDDLKGQKVDEKAARGLAQYGDNTKMSREQQQQLLKELEKAKSFMQDRNKFLEELDKQ
jgi:dTDP-4-amino-4,6-dideoxygalactose transaminase